MTDKPPTTGPKRDLLAEHYRGDPANHTVTPSEAAKKAGWHKKAAWTAAALITAGVWTPQGGRLIREITDYVSDVAENYRLQAPVGSRAVFETVAGYRAVAPYYDGWNSVQSRFTLDHQDGGLKVYQEDVRSEDMLIAKKSSSNEAKRLLAQMEMRQEVQLIKDPLAKLFAIQIYNRMTIKYDSILNKLRHESGMKNDQLQTRYPSETFKKGSGTCIDWSIATYRSVTGSGFYPDHVKVLGMRIDFKDGSIDNHAAVVVNIDGRNYVMDVGSPVVLKADALLAAKSPNLATEIASIELVDATGADGSEVFSQTRTGPSAAYKMAEDGIIDGSGFSPDDSAIIDDIAARASDIAKLPVYMTPTPRPAAPGKMPPPLRR